MQDLQLVIFEHIDMRSFSNLWFWIALAVMWSTASHWILGVPYDMVSHARRHGDQAQRDLEDLVRINVNRLLYISHVAGLWLLGLACFLLSGLLVLGFWYHVEFAQALFLLAFPMSLVALMSFATARLIAFQKLDGDDLCRLLARHRFWIQLLGVFAIFVTAMWGMYQNLTHGALGG